MAIISWNEIRARAAKFADGWKDRAPAAREEADAQTFENEFFRVFGVPRSKVAVFERKVTLRDGFDAAPDLFGEPAPAGTGYIDLFWPAHILAEMKTPGKDLQKAYEQAKRYANALSGKDLPRGILICDFVNFHYYDLRDNAKPYRFTLAQLPEYVELFGYLAGYREFVFEKADPVNIEAAELMDKLHDRLKETGYRGHALEVYLVRLVFCLFADDTGIFEHDHFVAYIAGRTSPDGSDLALHLAKIFEVLNNGAGKRALNIDEQLNAFPYINGGLFEERLGIADFDSAMRDTLLACCRLDWGKISPAVFGALFQGVMDEGERHDLGAHYTSEENILKVIRPLFLDGLRAEFEKIKTFVSEARAARLAVFHDKLASLTFLDPACGCGNFLVVAYRELRRLEIDVIKEIHGLRNTAAAVKWDVENVVKVNVNQFYGVELEDFPVQIAQTALWLADHQMNRAVSDTFGVPFLRIPLTASATIVHGNALALDWTEIVPPAKLSYILGNPPFLGARIMSKEQKSELETVFSEVKNSNNLDYVTCWYKKAAQYIQGTRIEAAFVSTNSICQGEQVPILWSELLNRHGIKINFAHQTFKWSNEARGKAAVYCVIIGFSLIDRQEKKLYLYETVTSQPVETSVKQINAYLVDAPLIFIEKTQNPLCRVSEMVFGSMPNDDGHFLLTETEKDEILKKEPAISEFIRPFLGADEFINDRKRYCIWLKGAAPEKYSHSKEILERIAAVKAYRASSTRDVTQKLANFPTLFGEIRQPDSDYLLIPSTSSEKRKYIPIGFIDKYTISSNANLLVPNATLYEFGVITSGMHMAWMRCVCGRLKSDYRYSGTIVYNNFPWPAPADKQKATIEQAAQAVLDARALFPASSLADLYDPLTMPPELTKAHQKLDKAVEKAYGRVFADDAERVAYLFELYQQKCGELFAETKRRGKGRKV
ncbi:class I SAM-dependent DNA methyltransferase [Treponema endosymbiont of Eucomonympha sp.]|uniref:class I SAM-dependent DNA methyltransferase n=1 Tax=Treponema endosymbiont of Eucomonympha sp. TaxID=1580831 RepID=UPI0007829395|nr:DNA methyltransferase [Treponema endosymbiont of Eucomonympha sp.]